MPQHDVLIIGAGLAGQRTALAAADAGDLHVLRADGPALALLPLPYLLLADV